MRTVIATRYVTPLREGGSLPGLVEADDDGLYVVKFRGAGQGPRALVAEWLAGELARAIGLPVPDLVAVEVDPALGDSEPDEEIHDLVGASGGLNLGMDFLPGALTFNPAAATARDVIDADFAADVVWLDALATNPDRSPQNPNLLVWHGRPWLIDHGAALYIHHTWRDRDEHARRPFERIADHVLLPYAGSIQAADERHAARIGGAVLADLVAALPAVWLPDDPTIGDAEAQRAAYVRYLIRRLEPPRDFVKEADRARAAA
ncbi:MAG: HipA family kinase [Chloroflexota bacterium]